MFYLPYSSSQKLSWLSDVKSPPSSLVRSIGPILLIFNMQERVLSKNSSATSPEETKKGNTSQDTRQQPEENNTTFNNFQEGMVIS